LTRAIVSIESALRDDMMTPFELAARVWLAAWPLWGVVPPPSSPPPESPRTAVVAAIDARDSPAALLALGDEELASRIESDPASLGSVSIGSAGSAVLFNAVALPADPRWHIAPGAESWATTETIEAIQIAVDTVRELFADTPPMTIGDISGPTGGRLKRHESHQAGRDVDFGFFYRAGKGTWYTPGTAANLDLPRNWAFLRALVARTDVERVFLDTRIQKLLYKHALSIGEDKLWLDRVFQFSRGARDAIVEHLPKHRTHFHVRFYNPVAQELGRRAHPVLVQLNMIAPPVFTVRHVVRSGQTLSHLASRYGVSTSAIMQANGLRTTRLRVGRAYRIPLRAAVPTSQPITVPPRLLPPQTPPAMAAIDWPIPASPSETFRER
jgi:penicillin-insensitive murein endopeptidase